MVKIEELRLAPEISLKIDENAVHRKCNEGFIYQEYCGYLPPRHENESITKINAVVFIDRHTHEVMMNVYAKSYQRTMIRKREIWAWENLWKDEVCKNSIASDSGLAKQLEEIGYDIEKVTMVN